MSIVCEGDKPDIKDIYIYNIDIISYVTKLKILIHNIYI